MLPDYRKLVVSGRIDPGVICPNKVRVPRGCKVTITMKVSCDTWIAVIREEQKTAKPRKR